MRRFATVLAILLFCGPFALDFADAAGGDLHLTSSALAIDVCPQRSEVTVGIDGESRDAAADAGADERVP